MNYASGGIGLLNHLAMEQFRAAAGFEAVVRALPRHRPGDQRLPRRPDHDDDAGPRRRAAAHPLGKMRPIAITGLKRHALLPDVPTFEESGFKGFDGVQWYGIVGPAKLPADITQAAERRDQQGARLARAAASAWRPKRSSRCR